MIIEESIKSKFGLVAKSQASSSMIKNLKDEISGTESYHAKLNLINGAKIWHKLSHQVLY